MRGNLCPILGRNRLRNRSTLYSVSGNTMILKRFFQRPCQPERSVYEAIVAAARHPVFYAEWGVADTLDGRFDMISLHTFLVLDRLKGAEQTFRQELVDEFFRDMDRSLREMGVGDVSVGKKVRKMAEVFYGRVAAYDAALAGQRDALEAALARNVFPDEPAGAGAPAAGRLCAATSAAISPHRMRRPLPAARAVQGANPMKQQIQHPNSPGPLQTDRVPKLGSTEKLKAEPEELQGTGQAHEDSGLMRSRPKSGPRPGAAAA